MSGDRAPGAGKRRPRAPAGSKPAKAAAVRIPKLRRHKPSGRALVELGGKVIYVGKWGTKASEERYRQEVAAWLAAGAPRRRIEPRRDEVLRIETLVAGYWTHLQASGVSAAVQEEARLSLRPLDRLFGRELAESFGPKRLRSVRATMIEDGLSRSSVNRRVRRIVAAFRWTVAEELLPGGVLHALEAVAPLRRGEGAVKEGRKIRPVAWEHVEPVLEHLTPTLRAAVELQWWTGMRPGELLGMRPCDLEWHEDGTASFSPDRHKNEHRGHERNIALGPRAVAALRTVLDRVPAPPPDSPVFSPQRSEGERRAEQRTRRRTSVTPSQARRQAAATRRAKRRARSPSDRYDVPAYRRAIKYAIATANAARIRAAVVEAVAPLVPEGARQTVAGWLAATSARSTIDEGRLTGRVVTAASKAAERGELPAGFDPTPLVGVALQAARETEQIPPWHPHMTRHSCATRLRKAASLEAARAVLGHSGVNVTTHYAEQDSELARAVMRNHG